MDLEEFNDEVLNILMEEVSKGNKNIFLLGDFNVDLIKAESDVQSSKFFDIITSNLFVPHITCPTRLTSTSSTLIDNIYSNSLNFGDGISGNITSTISDHYAQFLIIPNPCNKVKMKHNFYKRDRRNFDRENFLLDLLDIDWQDTIQVNKNDPNYSFNKFETKLNTIVDKYMPLKKLTNKEIKQKFKPWITIGIRTSMKRRDKLYKKYLKAKDAVIKEDYHKEYKELRNQIVSLCRDSKKAHFQRFFTENANNTRNTWKGIKSIINIRNCSRNTPNSLIVDNKMISEPIEIANKFNNYFSTIAENLQDKIHDTGQDFRSYLKNRNENSFFISPTDKHEIINIINNLNVNKSTGPHSIPSDILNLIKINIADPLAEIVNMSFANAIYISNLKISKAVPVFKEKGSNLECNNYRPISLLSNINKIVEKLMYTRLYKFLTEHKCIYELQFGFRKHHSTNHALISLTEQIRKALDSNKYVGGIFIDLQKAFDTVDHKILLGKLDHYGIRGKTNEWFKSYLANRKQYVSINGFNSEEKNMEYGVPQGSVLGPLLFLIYINDIHHALKYSTTRLFADDTNLLIESDSLLQLQKLLNLDLRNLSSWLKANKISLNTSKTELIIFRHPNRVINYCDLKVKIEGKRLVPSKYVKYLGILIDSHLNWQYHANFLATKLSRAIGMLSKIRHYVTKSVLRSIYFGIFSSMMTYGCQIWGQMQNQHINRLVKLQNKAIRIINFAPHRSSSTPLYKNSKILKLGDTIKLLNFLHVLNCLKGIVPDALKDSFTLIKNNHNHNTRGSSYNQVKIPKARTQVYGIKSISYQSAQIWNLIVKTLCDTNFCDKSKSTCKNIVTKHLLQKY